MFSAEIDTAIAETIGRLGQALHDAGSSVSSLALTDGTEDDYFENAIITGASVDDIILPPLPDVMGETGFQSNCSAPLAPPPSLHELTSCLTSASNLTYLLCLCVFSEMHEYVLISMLCTVR